MSVRINLEIGHEAALRSKRTIEGYTHDWEIYIKGCDNADIHYYIEKVVFHLHSTFTNPKRVIKEPPYKVRESGYAGFSLPIEIYLRNNEEPKKIRFTYDLNLQTTGPVVKVQKEKYVFYNPNEDFRRKLMKGGAVESGSSSDSSSAQDSAINEKLKQLKQNADLVKKHRVKEHKAEDSFRDLFGTPITKTSKVITEPKPPVKPQPPLPPPTTPVDLNINNQVKIEKNSNPKKSKSKHSPKDKERDKEKKDKNPDEKKKHKEEKKSKERSKDKERKDKSGKRDKSPKQPSESPTRSPKQQQRPPSPKRAPSPKRPPSPPPIKIKEEKKDDLLKDKLKSESKKSRHEQKEKDKDKEKKEHKSHKEKDVNRNPEQKDHKTSSKEIKPIKEPSIFKPKEKPVKEEPPILLKEEKIEKPKFEKNELDKPEKQKHKHKKKDSKEKKEKKDEKIKEKKSDKKLDKSEFFYKEEPKVSTSEIDKNSLIKQPDTSPDRNNIRDKSRALTELQNDSSSSSIESVEDPIEIAPKIIAKESKKKDKSKIDINEKKRKRKIMDDTSSKEETTPVKVVDEPPTKVVKNDDDAVATAAAQAQLKHEVKPDEMSEEEVQEMPLNYMNMLRELQHKIMTLQDNNELQQVVQLIAETGQFEITAQTFDFDLCTLDRNTVQKLQEFFAIS